MTDFNPQGPASPESNSSTEDDMDDIEREVFNYVKSKLESMPLEERIRRVAQICKVHTPEEEKQEETVAKPRFNPQAVEMTESKVKEDMEAFEHWKLKWTKKYSSPVEEKARFERFQLNLRKEEARTDSIAVSPWMALDQLSDLSVVERYKLETLGWDIEDIADPVISSDTDDEMLCKRADGTTYMKHVNGDDARDDETDEDVPLKAQSDHVKDTKKEEEEREATVPPAKCPKIGCDDKKRGCCSDCGTGT